jgi:hypothetical protein
MEENEKERFACPSCGTIVNEDAKDCPGCGALFENGIGSNEMHDPELNQDQGSSESWAQFPPPPDYMQKQSDPISGLIDTIPAPPELEEDNSSIPLNDEGDKPEKPPLSVSEFSGSIGINEEQEETPHEVPENQMTPQEQDEYQPQDQDSKQEVSNDDGSKPEELQGDESQQGEPENQIAPQDQDEQQEQPQGMDPQQEPSDDVHQLEEPQQEEEQESDLPVSLQGLQRYKDYGRSIEDHVDQEKKIIKALKDYSRSRKKRYTMGTLFLGLGVILFVLLWLVVVYDVLVTETQAWFGAHIVLILVCAGIFFTFGLFMILTYPKSSLIEILAFISESKEKGRSTEN